jgi:Flp pilus assembly protein TadG
MTDITKPVRGRRRLPFRIFRRTLADHGGASAVEFAIVGPVFLMMLMGIVSYGGYFWIAHAVQQVANDSARVAIGGLTTSERAGLAQGVLTSEIGSYAMLTASDAAVTVADQNQAVTVTIAYDASKMPFWALYPMLPMPSSTITRSATVRLGGY